MGIDDCRHCGSGRVVPVLHARMIGQPYGGNPYRAYCLECAKFGPGVSKHDFKNHLHPHVLPKDGDKTNPEAIIPLEEWDESERYQNVVDRLEAYDQRDRPFKVVSDGGQSEGDEQETNRFECPQCGTEQTGYPDCCSHCGAAYEW